MNDYAKQGILLVVGVLLGLALLHFFGGNNNGIRDTDVKQQLETLSRNQQLLTTKLDGLAADVAQSQRRVESIAGRIANAEAGVSEVTNRLADSQIALTESAGLIAENERIISAIQQRAKGGAK